MVVRVRVGANLPVPLPVPSRFFAGVPVLLPAVSGPHLRLIRVDSIWGGAAAASTCLVLVGLLRVLSALPLAHPLAAHFGISRETRTDCGIVLAVLINGHFHAVPILCVAATAPIVFGNFRGIQLPEHHHRRCTPLSVQ